MNVAAEKSDLNICITIDTRKRWVQFKFRGKAPSSHRETVFFMCHVILIPVMKMRKLSSDVTTFRLVNMTHNYPVIDTTSRRKT